MIGTPPGGGRRRSTSSSLCETPPPPSLWSVSPVTANRQYLSNSPLRRSSGKRENYELKARMLNFYYTGTSPPVLSGPLAKVPILSSPNLSDNNNLRHSPIIPFGTRAMTLPEISEMQTFFNETANTVDQNITFMAAPELAEETLLEVRNTLNRHPQSNKLFCRISEGTQRNSSKN